MELSTGLFSFNATRKSPTTMNPRRVSIPITSRFTILSFTYSSVVSFSFLALGANFSNPAILNDPNVMYINALNT